MTLQSGLAKLSAARAEIEKLHRDNERLRWRHPTTIPEWSDLPADLRRRLVDLGGVYADDVHGGDFAMQFYCCVRDELLQRGKREQVGGICSTDFR